MGEIAEMMLDGTLCECCGCFIDADGDGIPRYCSTQCAQDRGAGSATKPGKRSSPIGMSPKPVKQQVKCPVCSRMVKITGLGQHVKDAHYNGGAQP